ncbi:hypothetical protein HDC92_004871 [Pedobacter sp. AK017]|uniref:hypothetical protein n=1 Tax=Pedobacter sp. AK017 TaxID=2723073 RepID=UPI00160E2D89|nr:hypothetical protein [Pedobacter sp. AK017]MBB5441166.1 hypothetical protein [Pedobacter sp. AK017]
MKQIKDLEAKLSNARNLIASGKIDDDDFRALKTGYTEQIVHLEERLTTIQRDSTNVEDLLNEGIEHLLKLDKGAKKADTADLRRLVSAMFPENFTFDGVNIRTARMNTILQYIYLITKN